MDLLKVENLVVGFETESGPVRVVEDVSFQIQKKQVVGLVGESGCGKSVTAMSIMRLLPSPPSFVDKGRIEFLGQDLLQLNKKEIRSIRGNKISMIFQEPMTSLNPTFTVGWQLTEAIRLHLDMNAQAARMRGLELLELVGIGAAERRLKQYPHELSGGGRQRVLIAMALACNPELIIADEPTTALDVTIQAQILDLLIQLRDKLDTAVLLITHDLGVVAKFCEVVHVMYAGRVVEHSPVKTIFAKPRHPYTRGLMDSIPRLEGPRGKLHAIPGMVPSPGNRFSGCDFHDRCERAIDRCLAEKPPLSGDDDHRFACWNPLP